MANTPNSPWTFTWQDDGSLYVRVDTRRRMNPVMEALVPPRPSHTEELRERMQAAWGDYKEAAAAYDKHWRGTR